MFFRHTKLVRPLGKLKQIEKDTLQDILSMHPKLSSLVSSQIPQLTVHERYNSGGGHYSYLTVDAAGVDPDVGGFFGHGFMEVEGLKNGAGFVIRIEKGKLDLLEIYSFGESTDRINFEEVVYNIVTHAEG